MFWRIFVLWGVCLWASTALAQNFDPYAGVDDPYWLLLHEPAVKQELEFTPAAREAYQAKLDDLDLRFFPLRNKSREVAEAGITKLTAETQESIPKLLTAKQRQRLQQIRIWRIGTRGLLLPEVVEAMHYSATQKERLTELLAETAAKVKTLQQEIADGQPRAPREKSYQDLQTQEQKQIVKLLKKDQLAIWKKQLGPAFDVSKLGLPEFKAPELVPTDEWINSSPLALQAQRGKVVVIHFYACGCINCIRNYPWYREWAEKFRDSEFVMIGIHSPETSQERDAAHVRERARAEKLTFPVLIDGKSENWDAWGNSMWPSVYVVDQRGYIRHFWPGELKWQGNDGEKYMRERIEALLAEQP